MISNCDNCELALLPRENFEGLCYECNQEEKNAPKNHITRAGHNRRHNPALYCIRRPHHTNSILMEMDRNKNSAFITSLTLEEHYEILRNFNHC
jgi:hypothetical protein